MFSVKEGENTVFAALNKKKKIKDKMKESSLSSKAVPSGAYFVLLAVTDPKSHSIKFSPIF